MGLELEVQVLRDEDRRGGVLLRDQLGAEENAVVVRGLSLEDGEQLLDRDAAVADGGLGRNETHRAAFAVRDAGGGVFRMFREEGRQLAMDAAGIATAFGLLVLELVEFAQDLQRNADVVVREAIEAIGIVKEDIRVEDEVLSDRGGGLQPVSIKRPALASIFRSRFRAAVDDEHLGLEGGSERTTGASLGGGIAHKSTELAPVGL